LYRNDGGNTNDWLRVRLVGRDRNLQGIGALITVHATEGAPPMVHEIKAGGQYLSQSEIVAHFGLGSGGGLVSEVRVRWPETGEEQVLTDVPRNALLVVEQPE
ncbi:MAG: ASPIC/UnbV domain-containing protein, partial [Deltaproteobacteria bacterium]|nr:ASPIC/UnbV domain-containing protein [Deltaproteobacteria bacterium]